MKWFKVKAVFLIQADSRDDAMDELCDILEGAHTVDNYYVDSASIAPKKEWPEDEEED